jgi:hypothetical protein
MKRKIQIESGLRTPDRGSRRNHLDEPYPIHENLKHTARQCRVLKKLRRPLIAAHRRQLNREPSLDHLAFQIAHTTISPNYPGEEPETLDREVLVVSADVSPQDGETDEQRVDCENANAARATRQQQKLTTAAPAARQQAGNTGQYNNNIGVQAPATPSAPQPHQQGNEPRANRLRARDLLRDFERDDLEVYNSPQTNLRAALAALNQLEDTPTVRHLQANVRVAAAQIEEWGPGYSRSAASSYSRSRSERPRQQHRNNDPLEPVVEEGRGENEVMLPVSPAVNAAANAPANAAANATGNVTNNAANAANVQTNAVANPRQNAGTQPPPVQANHAEGSQHQRVRDKVDITRCANYDRDHGVPDALNANKPIQATELWNMHDQELLQRAQYDQDNGPPDDLYVIPTACTLSASSGAINNFPVFSRRLRTIRYPKDFKPAIGKYDGRFDPSIWLKMYSIAARASEAMKTTWRDTSPL